MISGGAPGLRFGARPGPRTGPRDVARDGRWRRFVLRPDAGYAAGLEELHDLAHVSAWPRGLAAPTRR